MGKKIKLQIGDKFNRLTIIKEVEKKNNSNRRVECLCTCGTSKQYVLSSVLNGYSKSCGCLQKERASTSNKIHGLSWTRIQRIWTDMLKRCYNEKSISYRNYGGRGIVVCDEWRSSFDCFQKWAFSNGYEEHLQIERKDVNGNYNSENCKFVTRHDNMMNRRITRYATLSGVTKTIYDWSKEIGIEYKVLSDRIFKLKWSHEKALTTPKMIR